ncbi:hypothetical protein TYRP_008561 [Tyrophagus putrescentiae]|nr:hypothetical protein TYRP_008561 [Tyrophagus putrescentiae]
MVKSSDAVVKSCSAVEEPALPWKGRRSGWSGRWWLELRPGGGRSVESRQACRKTGVDVDNGGGSARWLSSCQLGARRRSGRGTKRRANVVVSAKPRERIRRQESRGLACTSVQGRESSGQLLDGGLRARSDGMDNGKLTGLWKCRAGRQ